MNLKIFRGIPLHISWGVNAAMFILAVVSGGCSILQIYVLSGFINEALRTVEQSRIDSAFAVALLILLLTVAVDWLTPGISRMLRAKAELGLLKNYRPQMLKKCAALKYSYLEQPDSQDLISRVLEQTEGKWQNIYQAILALLKLFISIAGVLVIIAGRVWWAAIVILLFCIPLFAFSVKGGKKNYQARRDASEYIRRYSYLDQILNNRECMDERKLFGYTDKVDGQYKEAYQSAFWIETKTHIHWALKTKLSGGLSAIAALLIISTLIQPTVAGRVSIGLFISLVNAVFLLTSQMSWGLSRNIDALVTGSEFCADMERFWQMPEEEGEPSLPEYIEKLDSIEFRRVSFQYPGAASQVLRDVSFTMYGGKNYALVGANGAGKTTVIKLLTGLYTDYQGEILINGKELREYTRQEQKGIFSVVYQDFVRHALSLRENCELGNPLEPLSEEKLFQLLEQFDLRETAENLPLGIDTPLGKIKEGGVDLSGGQWQKLAMVRALLRPAGVRILDEPTASLDPKMESEIYGLFQQLTDERLTILISHRLGFARLADEILVFAGGGIEEQGSFQALMEKRGMFCKMYEEQRSWYQ